MSKITFRADEALVERLEACDASKSEVMRKALRAYLDVPDSGSSTDGNTQEALPDAATADADPGEEATAGRTGDGTEIDPAATRNKGNQTLASDEAADDIDTLLADRIDELVRERLEASLASVATPAPPDVTVNVSLDDGVVSKTETTADRSSAVDRSRANQGDSVVSADEGSDAPERVRDDPTTEQRSEQPRTSGPASTTERGDDSTESERKTCAQCGEPVPDEHIFCPNCGEKASHRVFCDCGDELRTDWSFCPSCGRRTPAADVLDPR